MRPRRLGKISGEESAAVIRLEQALADAERRHDVAKGCVVLRKAFNRFLADAAGGTDAHFNAAERNDTNGLDHDTAGTSTAPRGITNGNRPVQPTMNPRLESLRIRAAESAQKFEDDASLKQVTLSRRVPSLSQLDLPKSQAKPQAKAAGSTMAADGPSGAQGGTPPAADPGFLDHRSENAGGGGATKSGDGGVNNNNLTLLRLGDTVGNAAAQERGMAELSQMIMRMPRESIDAIVSTVMRTVLKSLAAHKRNVLVNYRCSHIWSWSTTALGPGGHSGGARRGCSQLYQALSAAAAA